MKATNTVRVLRLTEAIDAAQAGNKAARLAGLCTQGFPVPPGLVVPAAVFAGAIAAAGGSPDGLVVPAEVVAAITDGAAAWGDVALAVRSSGIGEDLADASYAGLYTTVLDVRGEAALTEAVLACWRSAVGARVTKYRSGAVHDRGMAVLIQPMVPADRAGVAFTADPVTGERDVVVIDAVAGNGQRLVSGAVTPERWTVRADIATRLDSGLDPEDGDVLSEPIAERIAVLAREVEEQAGVPQDVEWAVAGDAVWLLQARPVTGLPGPPVTPVPPVRIDVDVPEGFWERSDTHAPLPWTTMTRTVFAGGRERGFEVMAAELGLPVEGALFRDIGGWEYRRFVPLGGKEPPSLPAWLAPLIVRLVPAMRKRAKQATLARRNDLPMELMRRWGGEWQPELSRRIAALRDVDPDALDDAELDAHAGEIFRLTHDGLVIHLRLVGGNNTIVAELAFACRDLLGWDDSGWLDLVVGTSTTSTAPARALAGVTKIVRARPALARLIETGAAVDTVLGADPLFTAAFAGYLHDFGCQVLRYEMAEPSLAERPDLVLKLIREQLASDYDGAATADEAAERRAAADRARTQLTARPKADRDRFERCLSRALVAYPVREDNEYFTISAPFALVRRVVLAIGRRLTSRSALPSAEDAFELDPAELRFALRTGTVMTDRAVRRAGQRAWALANPGPATYGTPPSPPPPSALPRDARTAMEVVLWTVEQIFAPGRSPSADGDKDLLSGIPASSGSYTGRVRVIRTESEFHRLDAGEVLVCPVTSPVWSVLFPGVGALITDTGGVLSHPAIIAREYGIPAVVATGDGTTRLHDGQLVHVDGTTGTVEILS